MQIVECENLTENCALKLIFASVQKALTNKKAFVIVSSLEALHLKCRFNVTFAFYLHLVVVVVAALFYCD